MEIKWSEKKLVDVEYNVNVAYLRVKLNDNNYIVRKISVGCAKDLVYLFKNTGYHDNNYSHENERANSSIFKVLMNHIDKCCGEVVSVKKTLDVDYTCDFFSNLEFLDNEFKPVKNIYFNTDSKCRQITEVLTKDIDFAKIEKQTEEKNKIEEIERCIDFLKKNGICFGFGIAI